MHLFSPDRPKLANDSPQLLNGCAAVPSIWFEPSPEGGFLVTTMVQTSARGYSNRHAIVPSLDVLGAQWAADPEATLANVFNWHGFVEEASHELSLEDIL